MEEFTPPVHLVAVRRVIVDCAVWSVMGLEAPKQRMYVSCVCARELDGVMNRGGSLATGVDPRVR